MAEENVRNTQVRCMRTTQFLKITAGSTYELPLSFKTDNPAVMTNDRSLFKTTVRELCLLTAASFYNWSKYMQKLYLYTFVLSTEN